MSSIKQREILFIDDNLVGDYSYAKKLFGEMIPLGKKWTSQMTLSFADDSELLDLAAKSGCVSAFVGIESLSKENLLSVNKSVNRIDRIEQQIAKVRSKGIEIEAAFITGLEHDDLGVFENIYEFCEKNKISNVNVWVYTPFPGTPIYSRFLKEGRILSRDWALYDFQHVVIQPKEISPEVLQEEADKLRRYFNSKQWKSKHIQSKIGNVRNALREIKNRNT